MADYYRFFRASILAVALSMLALPAHAACWQWSKTAAANATADPSINWAEGMSPSSVNDSARAMMARIAECRDDKSGALTTAGTSTAYTLTTNQSASTGIPATPPTGQMLAFVVHATNGLNPTLRVDGGTVYALEGSPGVAVPAATLVQGTPYTAMFNGATWILRDYFANPYSVPLGGMMPYTGATAPNSNFVLPYGQAISRTVYADYFSQVGTAFGAGDGTTTFNVPDVRGRVIAGKDDMGGVSANRLTAQAGGVNGDILGGVGGLETHTLTTAQIPAHNHVAVVTDPGHTHTSNGNTNPAPTGASIVGGPVGAFTISSIGTSFTGITVTTQNTGGDGAHNNVQPTIIFNYILRIF